MSRTPLQPDDPRLTAYVLGELDAAERAAVEAHLTECAQSRTTVDELRQTTSELFEALQAEPVPTLSTEQRTAILEGRGRESSVGRTSKSVRHPKSRPELTNMEIRPVRADGRRGIVPLLTATIVCAALLIGVSIHQPDRSHDSFYGDNFFGNGANTLAVYDESQAVGADFQTLIDLIQSNDGGEFETKLSLVIRQSQTVMEGDFADDGLRRFDTNGNAVAEVERLSELQRGVMAGRGGMLGQTITSNGQAKPTVSGNLGGVTDLSTSLSGRNYPIGDLVVPSASKNDGYSRGHRFSTVDSFGVVVPNFAEGRTKTEYSVPQLQTGQAVTQMARSAGEAGQQGRQPANAPFRTGPSLNLAGRDNFGGGVVSGFVEQNTSSADKDVLLRQMASGRGGAYFGFGMGEPIMTNTMSPGTEYLLDAFGKTLGRSDSEVTGRPSLQYAEQLVQESRPQIVPLFAMLPADAAATKESAPLGWRQATLTWDDGQWFFKNGDGDKVVVEAPGTEAYAPIVENEFLSPADAPLSTFGLDVDTASYANVRRFLMGEGRFPPPDAVRIEELVNYFAYSDAEPPGDEPVGVTLEAAACLWNTDHRLVRIGLKAKTIDLAERPPTTLVFLVDTSGSMRGDKKLPLVKQSLRLLAQEMTENDRISIVTYSSAAGLLLDSTSGDQQDEIIAAIDGLQADGSTNGEAGLKLAYDVATKHFIKEGQNRVILCTDGDFNVGTSATDPLVGMISEKRASGVFLSICGYGSGNIKDEKLERIADTGNGQYHYIDGLKEARKVFLDELTGTLYTVAKDVKLQVEFNPANVAAYRLLGYENRTMAAEDFNNDRVDSGDMGAGHSVTALYEVVPAGTVVAKPASKTSGVDPLKYKRSENDRLAAGRTAAAGSNPTELLTVKLRYKQPDGDESVKREFPLIDAADDGSPSQDLEWSAAVASFGMLLRGSQHAGQSSLEGILELAQGAKGRDESGRRREFIDMVLQTQSFVRQIRGEASPKPPELSSVESRKKAMVGGKYRDLLDKLEQRSDVGRYGAFHDYGWSGDKSYASREGLPAGYWVYVYPDWYIWGETVSAE